MELQINFLTLPDGTRLQYAESGSSNGMPALLLHGVTDSLRSFEPVLPHLPPSIRAIALTQRGHGDSDRPPTGYRTRDFAADSAAVLDALDIERCVIVGHSMGSANAMRFAIDFPQRTAGLVLAGAFASFRRNAGAVEFWETTIRHLKVPARVWRAAFAGMFEDDFARELGRISAPTLIVWGARDAFCPQADQLALKTAIARARLMIYPDAGHAVHRG